MTPLHIFLHLLDKPDVPKFYRQLQEIYQSQNKITEAEAFNYLIEKKFGKNHEQIDISTVVQKEL